MPSAERPARRGRAPKPGPAEYFFALLGAPIFVAGYLLNQLRYYLSQGIVNVFLPRLKRTDSAQMIVGLLLFPLLWLLISGGVFLFSGQFSIALSTLLVLPLLSQFTYYYWEKILSLTSYLKYWYCIHFRDKQARTIAQTYDEILYLLRKSVPTQVISA